MTVVVNELDVVTDTPPTPSPAAVAPPAGAGAPSHATIAEYAERAWRRVADLGERVRAD